MAPPRQKKCKANRNVPVPTTMITDTTIPPPRTRISKLLRWLDVHMPAPNWITLELDRLYHENSELQNIVSPVSTRLYGYQTPPNT